MKKLDEDVNRRDFGKLALAAFSGVLAASAFGSSIVSADSKRAAAAPDTHACCTSTIARGRAPAARTPARGRAPAPPRARRR
jgi:hypothetical protein